MEKRPLPIGIQSFRELRDQDCYYVDKTGYALRLIAAGGNYFLSRPRHFGKSLFVDTLKHLFEGNQDLFVGLESYDQWDWSVRYPVVKMSFGDANLKDPDSLQANVQKQLLDLEIEFEVEALHQSDAGRLRHLIRTLHRQTGRQVVVLVDDYDKPILDALGDPAIARANRDYLLGFFSVLKSCDEHARFTLLTGVGNFSRGSLFSGLNNLNDITMAARYSAVCGFTEGDLDTVFAAELPGLDREHVRGWYNGYRWGGEGRVYSPLDVLQLFARREFKPWWFESGTARFLVETLIERNVSIANLDGMRVSGRAIRNIDLDGIAPEVLLFQTGYLTIGGEETSYGESYYRLVYPNQAVRHGLTASLPAHLTGMDTEIEQHRDSV